MEDMANSDRAKKNADEPSLPVSPGYSRFYWKLHIITYNLNKIKIPPDEFRPDLLYPVDSVNLDFDMIAVGFQELNYMPNHYLKDTFLQVEPWTNTFRQFYASRGFIQFSLNSFAEVRMMGIALLVFVKRELSSLIRKAEVKYIRTGFSGYSGHKGAVCARFTFGDGIHVTFINSHLSSDVSRVDYRIWEFQTIMARCAFEPPFKLTDDDYVFWFGDLNFRVQNISSDDAAELVEYRQFERLLDFDQLTVLRKSGMVFHQFEEAKIAFKPTYKYILGTTQLDVARMPSYCDRILWRCTATSQSNCSLLLGVSPLKYEAFIGITASDHRPVIGAFSIMLYLPNNWSPPIQFEYPSRSKRRHWVAGRDNYCKYIIKDNYEPSFFDWIGVFKVEFSSDKDVATYAYMITAWEEGQVDGRPLQNMMFRACFIPPVGLYLLACYSRSSQCLISISEPFEIIDPQIGALRSEFTEGLWAKKYKALYGPMKLRRKDPKKVDLDQIRETDAFISQPFTMSDKVSESTEPPPGIPHKRIHKKQ